MDREFQDMFRVYVRADRQGERVADNRMFDYALAHATGALLESLTEAAGVYPRTLDNPK
jgi:hypothetical protein